MYSVFLSSYTNTRESLGELEKALEALACGSCFKKALITQQAIQRRIKNGLSFYT